MFPLAFNPIPERVLCLFTTKPAPSREGSRSRTFTAPAFPAAAGQGEEGTGEQSWQPRAGASYEASLCWEREQQWLVHREGHGQRLTDPTTRRPPLYPQQKGTVRARRRCSTRPPPRCCSAGTWSATKPPPNARFIKAGKRSGTSYSLPCQLERMGGEEIHYKHHAGAPRAGNEGASHPAGMGAVPCRWWQPRQCHRLPEPAAALPDPSQLVAVPISCPQRQAARCRPEEPEGRGTLEEQGLCHSAAVPAL